MPMSASSPLVVVGSGVTGLASALALASATDHLILCGKDDPATIHMPQADEHYRARVYALNHLSCRVLEKLGAWSSIMATGRAHPYTCMKVWEKDSAAYIDFHAAEVGATQLGYIVESDVIKAALWQQLNKTSHIEIACPSTATAIELQPQRTSLQLDNGRLIHPALLVGADGAHSMVCRAMGCTTAPQDYGQDALVALMLSAAGEEKCCWQCFSDLGISAWLPVGKGLGVVIWCCARDQAQHLMQCSDQQFSDAINHLLAARLGALQLKSKPLAFPLYGHLVTSYVAGHCVLLGDAAHTVHPLAGQGANLGLADVDCLSQALDYYRRRGRPWPSLAALQHYQRMVKGRNWAMKSALDLLLKCFARPDQAVRSLRSHGLRLINRCAPIKNWLMHQAMWPPR